MSFSGYEASLVDEFAGALDHARQVASSCPPVEAGLPAPSFLLVPLMVGEGRLDPDEQRRLIEIGVHTGRLALHLDRMLDAPSAGAEGIRTAIALLARLLTHLDTLSCELGGRGLTHFSRLFANFAASVVTETELETSRAPRPAWWFRRLAADKHALLRLPLAVAAEWGVELDRDGRGSFGSSFDRFLEGVQWFDDLADVDEDRLAGRCTPCVREADRQAAKGRPIDLDGLASRCVSAFAAAHASCPPHLDRWRRHLATYAELAEDLAGAAWRRALGGRSPAILARNRAVDEALARGLAALLERQDADGAWRDFDIGGQRGDVWPTAFIARSLAYSRPLRWSADPVDDALTRAGAFLEATGGGTPGWGFCGAATADADSTANVVVSCALGVRNGAISETGDRLVGHYERWALGDGLYRTYDAAPFPMADPAYQEPDVSVTATVAESLVRLGGSRGSRAARRSSRAIEALAPGGLDSLWWASPMYSLYAIVRLLEALEPPAGSDAWRRWRRRAVPLLRRHRAADGGWCQPYALGSVPFVTGLAVIVAARFGLRAEAESGAASLLRAQRPDGSWPPFPIMHVPWRDDGSLVRGPSTLIADSSATFATAAAWMGLAAHVEAFGTVEPVPTPTAEPIPIPARHAATTRRDDGFYELREGPATWILGPEEALVLQLAASGAVRASADVRGLETLFPGRVDAASLAGFLIQLEEVTHGHRADTAVARNR